MKAFEAHNRFANLGLYLAGSLFNPGTHQMKIKYLLPILLVGCSSPGVVKIGDNLYQIKERSETLQAAGSHIPDPAIDDIKNASDDYCKKTNQKVKVISYDRPQDPTIRQGYFDMKFSCVNDPQ